ncbi:MAG: hypothetical protein HY559_01765 [Gammaproteobacteria bacterium]|nr:hypothetical protein [Gammaproteobacteria bacterium]
MRSSLLTHLPVFLEVPDRNIHWYLKDLGMQDEVLAITKEIEDPTHIPGNRLYKQGVRRLIFHHNRVLVKAFPLKFLRHRLKHKRYAWNEAHHLLQAKERHLPVPEVMGYGVAKRWGVVFWCAVLMEHVDPLTMGQCLSQSLDETLQWQYLLRALPLFKKIYHAGCNHLDLKPDSILLANDETGDVLIDFQYVVYLENPKPEILVMQAAHFAWEASVKHTWIAERLMSAWFEVLLDYLGLVRDPKLWQIFQKARCRKTTIEQRMSGTIE